MSQVTQWLKTDKHIKIKCSHNYNGCIFTNISPLTRTLCPAKKFDTTCPPQPGRKKFIYLRNQGHKCAQHVSNVVHFIAFSNVTHVIISRAFLTKICICRKCDVVQISRDQLKFGGALAVCSIGATTIETGGHRFPPTFRLGDQQCIGPPNFLAVVFKKQEISQQVVTRMQDLASKFSKNFPGVIPLNPHSGRGRPPPDSGRGRPPPAPNTQPGL